MVDVIHGSVLKRSDAEFVGRKPCKEFFKSAMIPGQTPDANGVRGRGRGSARSKVAGSRGTRARGWGAGIGENKAFQSLRSWGGVLLLAVPFDPSQAGHSLMAPKVIYGIPSRDRQVRQSCRSPRVVHLACYGASFRRYQATWWVVPRE
eukprot:757123-Hanusia_phi.AAC.5